MRTYFITVRKRRYLAILVDTVIVTLAYYLALTFRFEGSIPQELDWGGSFAAFVALAIVAHVAANHLTDAYTIVNRYIGLKQALRVLKATVVASAALTVVVAVLPTESHLTPLSVVPVGGIMAVVGMIGVRFYSRIFHERSLSNVQSDKNLLIVGAGHSANAIIREIDQGQVPGTRVAGIVDDTAALRGMRLYDLPILGTLDDLGRLIDEEDITDVLIALDDPRPEQIGYIHRVCHRLDVPVKTVPRVADIVGGQALVSYARELKIEDFLGRPPVDIDMGAIAAYLKGRRVLVTGAAGSIGSELSRQITAFSPESLILVDKDESGLYYLREELTALGVENCVIKPTSVALQAKMERLFATHRPQVVFHAAAFKHVPLMELSPDEAVINNVRGTLVIAEAAGHHGVERVVNISTDKAVDPSSVMGATKRLGESIMRLMASKYPETRFCSVRFGNVLGSRGSVLPLFKQQIEAGGPVTVTHPAMERYFMTIEEAVKLVLQAAALIDDLHEPAMSPPGPFILEMGEPVKIVDVAHKMISLLNGNGQDTYVIFTGLRPGEKLTEELFSQQEHAEPTGHPMIRLAGVAPGANGDSGSPHDLERRLRHLIAVAEDDAPPEDIIAALKACVPSYRPLLNGDPLEARTSDEAPDDLAGPGEWLDAEDMVEPIRLSKRPAALEIAGAGGTS